MKKFPKEVVYGLGGTCEPCDPSHDHPLNNIVLIIEYTEEEWEQFVLDNNIIEVEDEL
jgi:hypothetical protein